MNKPILCLDFDGVLHSYTSGWQGADVISDLPVTGAVHFVMEALEHFDIHIYSSRSHQKGGIQAMKAWMDVHFGSGMSERLSFPDYKPSAFLTIDDRALTFEGTWPDPFQLKSFKPWNKRGHNA